ncbi:MAG: ABC transporter ATP-binding protein [Phycisphaerales bacterium]
MAAPSPLARLFRYAAPHRGRIALAAGCSVLNKLLDLAPPVLIGMAIDVVSKKEDSFLAGLGVVDVRWQLVVLATLTLLIWGGESLFEYFSGIAWRGLAQILQHGIRLDAWRSVSRLELPWFEERATGGVMSVLSDDVNQLERFLDAGADRLIQIITTVILVGALFFGVSPSVAVLAMLPMPLVIWGSLRFQRRIGPRYASVRQRTGDLNARLAATLGGIVTIKSFTGERREAEQLEQLSDAYRETNESAIRLSSAFSPLIRMAIVVGFTGTLVWGGWLAIDGRLDPSLYAVLVFMTQRLLWPLTGLGQTLDEFQRAMASVTRILDLVDAEPTITDGPASMPPLDGRRARPVRFSGIGFAYRAGHDVIHDLDLDCQPGTTTALVGSTGCGKTTLIKLLLRLYEHDDAGTVRRGQITVDDVEIRTLPLAALRQAIALVPQEPFLFPGTIRENIAYGAPAGGPSADAPTATDAADAADAADSPDAPDEAAIVAAAVAAEADAFIRGLPDGYDTIVGERGQRLSGGQRQRLAMARAILKDAPILVLDEATSAVDNETEAAMQRSLAEVSRGRTTIVIAHRLSTIRHAHAIHVMEAGRIVESGTHEDLLAAGGRYADLWRVQTGDAAAARRT